MSVNVPYVAVTPVVDRVAVSCSVLAIYWVTVSGCPCYSVRPTRNTAQLIRAPTGVQHDTANTDRHAAVRCEIRWIGLGLSWGSGMPNLHDLWPAP